MLIMMEEVFSGYDTSNPSAVETLSSSSYSSQVFKLQHCDVSCLSPYSPFISHQRAVDFHS